MLQKTQEQDISGNIFLFILTIVLLSFVFVLF